MPEYTYLLETRLSTAQQNALAQVRDAARDAGMVVFLTGGAVRDLTTGSSVRDLDFSVQGNALELEESLVQRGAKVWGRHTPSRTTFLWMPGSVRVEIASTRSESFPKPGQPVYTWSGIVDDLFRRDFTVNAMALSLNEGSYGLLLDPLNGVADTEARQLRLVSNYGFLEDPVRLLRAMRLGVRLGWSMEERTATRYQNASEADLFEAISSFQRGYELEEIAAEDDALGALRAFEAEGWLAKLFPGWSSAHADTAALDNLHRYRIQLLMQGIAPDLTAAHLELLTAKMKPADRKALKEALVRPGLVAHWESLESDTKEFGKLLAGREAASASATWRLFHEHAAEPVLWLAHTGKGASETRFNNLFQVWPEIAKKVPVAMMAEMRITSDLPAYPELLHELFLAQIDGKLQTDEEMRAFLEKYSPPAPPPPVSLKRSRGRKAEGKSKRRGAAGRETEREAVADDADADEPSEAADKAETAPAAEGKASASPARTGSRPKPAKTGSAAVEAARAGAVSLEGVDLGAMLQRIGSGPGAKQKHADAPPAAAPAKEKSAAAPAKPAAKVVLPKSPAKATPVKPASKPAPAKAAANPAASRTGAPAKTPAGLKVAVKKAVPVQTPKEQAKKAPAKGVPLKKAPAKKAQKPAAAKAVTARKAPAVPAKGRPMAKKATPKKAAARPSPAAAKKQNSIAKPSTRRPSAPAKKGKPARHR